MSATQDDRALLVAWQRGDERAGRQLVDRHFTSVHGFFSGRVEPDVADDLVQQTFLACIERGSSYRGEGSFKAFMLGIARNYLLMHIRWGATNRRAMDHWQAMPDASVQSPSQAAAHGQEQHLLSRCLRQLPLEFQLVIELAYWEDMSMDDVARVLEIPPGTVKSRLSRARQKLAAIVEQTASSPALVESTVVGLDRWLSSMRRRHGAGAPRL